VLDRLPRGSGFVFRHYHLNYAERRQRYAVLKRLCRARGHRIVLAAGPAQARRWGADGSYGEARRSPTARLATVHDLAQIGRANRTGAALVLLSPVLPTRSHPGAAPLGAVRFLLLARRAAVPVIALGGMDRRRARRLPGFGWAAIDGLSHMSGRIPLDS